MGEIPPQLAQVTLSSVFQWAVFIMAATTLALFFRTRVKPFIDKLQLFLEDWSGVDTRPGVPGREGVMARLSEVEKELKPNNGNSFYDRVVRQEKEIQELKGMVHDLSAKFKEVFG